MKKAILSPATVKSFVKGCTFVRDIELNDELVADTLGEKFDTFGQMVDHCTELAEPKLKGLIARWATKFTKEQSTPKGKKETTKKAPVKKTVEKTPKAKKVKVVIATDEEVIRTEITTPVQVTEVEAPKVEVIVPVPSATTPEPPLKTVGTVFAYRGRWSNVKHRVLSFDEATNTAHCEIISTGKRWKTDVLNTGNFEPKIIIGE